MGQATIKRTRRIAEKTAKTMAFELAKAQIQDICQQPFRVRWAFCKAILFPKKKKLTAQEAEQLKRNSYGGIIPPAMQAQEGAHASN